MKLFPTFEDGAMVPEHLVKVVQLVSEKLQRPIKWQPNDLLILDNTRFMHGRRRIEDVTERLILTYFGFINFAEYSNEYPSDSAWRDPRRWELGID